MRTKIHLVYFLHKFLSVEYLVENVAVQILCSTVRGTQRGFVYSDTCTMHSVAISWGYSHPECATAVTIGYSICIRTLSKRQELNSGPRALEALVLVTRSNPGGLQESQSGLQSYNQESQP